MHPARQSHADEPQTPLRITDEFNAGLAEVQSDKALARIYDLITLLSKYPDYGSPEARRPLSRRYGAGLRKIVAAPYVIVYRHADDAVEVLALVYGPSVT